MAIHNNTDFGGVGINAALELARNIARHEEIDLTDQPIDYAGLARFARKTQTVEVAQSAPSVSRRATQPIACLEPNA